MTYRLYVVLMLLTFGYTTISGAQSVKIDSLKQVLEEPDLPDLQKIETLDLMSYLYHKVDPSQGIKYGHEMLDLAQDTDNQLGIGKAYNSIGLNLIEYREFDSASYYFNRAIVIFDEMKNYKQGVKSRLHIAVVLKGRREYTKAFKQYEDIEEYINLHEVEDEKSVSDASFEMGNLLEKVGDWHLAIKRFLQYYEFEKNHGDVIGQVDALISIGRVYKNVGQTTKAKKAYIAALIVSRDAGNVIQVAKLLAVMGRIHLVENSLDSAEQYLLEALEMRIEQKNEPSVMVILGGIAKVNKIKGQYEVALRYHMEALNKLSGSNDIMVIASIQLRVGHVHLLTGNIEMAEKYLMAGHQVADSLNLIKLLRSSNESLAQLYERKGAFAAALRHQKAYYALKDTLYNVTKIKELGIQEEKFEYRQEKQQLIFDQDSERLRLEQENEVITTRLIAAVGGLLLLFISVGFVVKAYREKAKANRKLRQLDQFKTRLFANINHDLRTPLTLMQGYIHRIVTNKENYLTSQSKEDLESLGSNALTLTEMTNEIQDLILLEEGKLELKLQRVEMTSYLRRQVLMFSSMAEMAGVDLTYESDVETLSVNIDSSHFEKILYNLLSNAFKFSLTGGQINVNLRKENHKMIVAVSDTGKGISSEDLPNIFDRFYQSPLNEYRSKEGFGIGLAVVHELVELHGGSIDVSSEIDKGTTFTIVLPFNLDKESAEETIEESVDKIKSLPTKKAKSHMVLSSVSGHTVLVVDDHEEIRQYIIDLMSNEYEVKEAANGKQALEVLEVDKVDLILTDLMMPWLDGFDLIEKLKESEDLRDIPIMVVSARTTEDDKHRVLDAGVNEFISKPFDPVMFQKRIANLLSDKSKSKNIWSDLKTDKTLASNLEQNILKKLNQIILENIDDSNLTIEVIASELSASRSKTIRLIKKLTNQTPLAYIKIIRMDFVNQLIKSNKVKNASEAAQAIGMSNGTQFASQYKKHFGTDPF